MDTYLQKTNIATELAVKAAEGKVEKTLEEMLPPHYLEYREVFEKKDFDTLPERRPWDHVIEMTPDFKPKRVEDLHETRRTMGIQQH